MLTDLLRNKYFEMNLPDKSGTLRLTLCFFNLFVNHGLRDYLITAAPSIASYSSVQDIVFLVSSTTGPDVTPNETIFESVHILAEGYEPNVTYKPVLNDEEGWTPVMLGLVLSAVYWTWAIALVVTVFLINPKKKKALLTLSLFISGGLALLTETAAGYNPLILFGMRTCQGFSQGLSYPLTFYILQDLCQDKFVISYFLIFLAPWLGSALGILSGGAPNVHYLGSYVFGTMCFLVSLLSLFTPLSGEELKYEPKVIWKEILTSIPVWSCILVHIGGVWALHTIIVGYTFTLYFKLNQQSLIWTVCLLLLIGGLVTRVIALVAKSLMRSNSISVINRRRAVVLLGNLIILATFVINGTIGVRSAKALIPSCLLGICGGASLCLVGARLNLHDLSPSFPIPILTFASIGAAVGAGLSSLLFPVLAQIESISEIAVDDESYGLAWLIPLAVFFLTTLFHLVVLSVNPLPYQTTSAAMNGTISKHNGSILNVTAGTDIIDLDAKSFKSIKSAASFKTAVSRFGTRTESFKTIDGDFHEIDLKSVLESDVAPSVHTAVEEGNEADLKSIHSGSSYRTIVDEKRRSVFFLDVDKIHQTEDWLRTSQVNSGQESSSQKIMVQKNILMAPQW